MTIEQFAGFVLMVLAATFLLEGNRLARVVLYCFAWQALTPVKPWYFDIPALLSVLIILELAWLGAKVGFICWVYDKKPLDVLIVFRRT